MSARGPLDFDDDDARGADRPAEPSGRPLEEPDAEGTAWPPAPPPARPPGTSRYTWFLGIAALLLIALVTLNSVGSSGVSTAGPDPGDRLVPFAVPLADAPRREDEDANVEGERACGVRGPGILNICEQGERGPVVFALFPTGAVRCRSVLDQFARLAPRHRRVRFVAVGSRGERGDLRGAGTAPNLLVGWDRDGAVASVYGLVGCPQLTFARRGGVVEGSSSRPLDDAELARRIRGLT